MDWRRPPPSDGDHPHAPASKRVKLNDDPGAGQDGLPRPRPPGPPASGPQFVYVADDEEEALTQPLPAKIAPMVPTQAAQAAPVPLPAVQSFSTLSHSGGRDLTLDTTFPITVRQLKSIVTLETKVELLEDLYQRLDTSDHSSQVKFGVFEQSVEQRLKELADKVKTVATPAPAGPSPQDLERQIQDAVKAAIAQQSAAITREVQRNLSEQVKAQIDAAVKLALDNQAKDFQQLLKGFTQQITDIQSQLKAVEERMQKRVDVVNDAVRLDFHNQLPTLAKQAALQALPSLGSVQSLAVQSPDLVTKLRSIDAAIFVFEQHIHNQAVSNKEFIDNLRLQTENLARLKLMVDRCRAEHATLSKLQPPAVATATTAAPRKEMPPPVQQIVGQPPAPLRSKKASTSLVQHLSVPKASAPTPASAVRSPTTASIGPTPPAPAPATNPAHGLNPVPQKAAVSTIVPQQALMSTQHQAKALLAAFENKKHTLGLWKFEHADKFNTICSFVSQMLSAWSKLLEGVLPQDLKGAVSVYTETMKETTMVTLVSLEALCKLPLPPLLASTQFSLFLMDSVGKGLRERGTVLISARKQINATTVFAFLPAKIWLVSKDLPFPVDGVPSDLHTAVLQFIQPGSSANIQADSVFQLELGTPDATAQPPSNPTEPVPAAGRGHPPFVAPMPQPQVPPPSANQAKMDQIGQRMLQAQTIMGK